MLWALLAAMAHGAGLMLVPIYLGLCDAAAQGAGHTAAARLMGSDALRAGLVALAHTLAMAASGGLIAVGVYYWLGFAFLKKSWFNLDIVWALSLIVVGAVALLASH
jgi:hypothetical protein